MIENNFSNIRLLRFKEVLILTGRSRTCIYTDIKDGVFPAPIKIGKRAIAWSSQDIFNWIQKRLDTGEKYHA